MDFEWDDKKDQANFEKHGIRFEEAALIFQGITLTVRDEREDYAERREISIGQLSAKAIIVVVHTDRQGVTRLISARPAGRRERKRYDEYCKKITQ